MKTTQNIKSQIGKTITIKWGVSRGRYTQGWTTCSLYNSSGKKISHCKGGGYDLLATVVGDWISITFKQELARFASNVEYYGLAFLIPKKLQSMTDKTSRISPIRTSIHTIPIIDGGCGMNSMLALLKGVFGIQLRRISKIDRTEIYMVEKSNRK